MIPGGTERPTVQQNDQLSREKVKSEPTIPKAGDLILSLFSPLLELPDSNKIPGLTQKLLREDVIFSESGGKARIPINVSPATGEHYTGFHIGLRSKTDANLPDSPVISQENVGRASTIITVTIKNFWLGDGPQTNLIFAYGEKGKVRAFASSKNEPSQEGLFVEIGSLSEVSGLVDCPAQYGRKPKVSLWEASGNHYELVSEFTCRLSLKGLLSKIDELQSPANPPFLHPPRP